MKKILWINSVMLLLLVIIFIFGCSQQAKKPETVKIGAILPMTGAAANYGKWMERGAQLAVEDVNNAGGINVKKLEVIIEDSKSDNRGGVDAANKLINIDKVQVLETALTGVTKSIIPITEPKRIILFTSATAPGLTEEGKYVFRNATNISNEVDRMIKACKEELKINSVALIYINNPVGLWIDKYFKKEFEAIGGKVPASESFQPDTTDFRTIIEKIKTVSPDAVYILGYQQNGIIMKQARELGLKCQFLGVTDFELPDVLKLAGDAAEGAVYTKASFDPKSSNSEVASFSEKYKTKYGEDPEVYGATVYDATRIIALAMTKAGTDPDAMKSYILSIKDYPGASGSTTFLPNGDVMKTVELKKIENGKFIPFEK